MDIPDRETKTQKTSGGLGILLFFVLLIIVMSTAAIAYLNAKGIDIKKVSLKEVFENRFFIGTKDKYDIESNEIIFNSSQWQEFVICKDYIVRCTNTGVEYFDKGGEQKQVFPVNLNNPFVKCQGEYLLIAEPETKKIYVFNGTEKIWEDKLEYNIINADINSSGYTAIVHRSDRGKTAVSVYNRTGEFLFTKIKGTTFIISAKVSPNGKSVLVNSVDYSGTNIDTGLELYTITGDNIAGKKIENMMIASLWFLDSNTIAAMGDSQILLLDKSLDARWESPVTGTIMSSGVMNGKYAVFAFAEKKGTAAFGDNLPKVLILDGGGREISDYTLNQDVVSIATGGELIAINTGKSVYFIDTTGRLRGSFVCEKEIKGVSFFGNREALVITKDSIIILKMG